jgi:hypothetical protein
MYNAGFIVSIFYFLLSLTAGSKFLRFQIEETPLIFEKFKFIARHEYWDQEYSFNEKHISLDWSL